jgi:hypothetical protein
MGYIFNGRAWSLGGYIECAQNSMFWRTSYRGSSSSQGSSTRIKSASVNILREDSCTYNRLTGAVALLVKLMTKSGLKLEI